MQITSFVVASLVAIHVMLGQAQTPALPGALITVVGCLTRQNVAPQPGTAPRGTPDTPAPFVLTDQTPPALATGTAGGSASSGATASGGQTPGRTMYVLRTEGRSEEHTSELQSQ